MVSNDEGTKRIEYAPRKGETCIDQNGREVLGLTYEGELNKVRGRWGGGTVASTRGVWAGVPMWNGGIRQDMPCVVRSVRQV